MIVVRGLAVMVVLGVASVAAARQNDDNSRAGAAVSVTPFVSIGSATSERVGTAVAWPLGEHTSVEAEVGYRPGGGGGARFSLGVVQDLPRAWRVTPYLAAGAGLEEHVSAFSSSRSGFVATRHVALTFNAGGGVRVPLVRDWDWRTDGRWFNSVGRSAGERWRLYNGLSVRMPGR